MKYLFAFFTALLLSISGCIAQDASKDNSNIILITIDALRADHLSCYGYERETSPNIDKIAEKGVIFNNVIAPSSWTVPSMVSLFTSVYPVNHGVVRGFAKKKKIHNQNVFSDDLTTLAELLKANGYDTFGVASNLHLSEKFGFARGFDHFKCLSFKPAPFVNRVVYSWESQIKNSDKFFLWLHYFDPHHPYKSRKPWIENYTTQELTQKFSLSSKSSDYLQKHIPTLQKEALSNLVALYDSDINYVDAYIGELINKFELDENTLIIITADHGEEFFEHGRLGHGYNLHQETIKIPLIIKPPRSPRKETVDEYVNLVDIIPTIVDILNINPSEQMLGKSALKKKLVNEDMYTELDRNALLKAILTPDWKYIYNYKNETDQLYNIKSDPKEHNNLADKKVKQCNQLKEQLVNWVATSKKYPIKSQVFEISQEEKEKLEAMGYLETPEETSLKKSQGQLMTESGKRIEEVAKKSSQRTRIVESENATIELVNKSDNCIGINLINNIPVQGVQFTIEGVKMTEIRTISRASGIVASFNKESGTIILMASSGENIATGKGLIAEITCDKIGSVNLSAIKVAK